jgi:hypothetical protein
MGTEDYEITAPETLSQTLQSIPHGEAWVRLFSLFDGPIWRRTIAHLCHSMAITTRIESLVFIAVRNRIKQDSK